ncbi:MAG TPA: alpha/beta hydrolase, partial [Gammaproteobacteria bacterium]|nr:alpha/beta hydrolase [Gammaproteobacteria bacterium]
HTPNLLKRIGKPVLVVAGSEDSVVGPLAQDVEPLSGEQIQFILIDGADHFFLDLYLEEVAEEVVEWLQQ